MAVRATVMGVCVAACLLATLFFAQICTLYWQTDTQLPTPLIVKIELDFLVWEKKISYEEIAVIPKSTSINRFNLPHYLSYSFDCLGKRYYNWKFQTKKRFASTLCESRSQFRFFWRRLVYSLWTVKCYFLACVLLQLKMYQFHCSFSHVYSSSTIKQAL